MYDSYEEVYGVLQRLRPGLEAKFQAKGFVVLAWADGGWVRFFSKKPVATPDDLRALKLFTWSGNAEAVELLKAARFNPVPLPSTELATALQTGLVQAFGTPPGVALIAQYYTHTKYMTDLEWQILLGRRRGRQGHLGQGARRRAGQAPRRGREGRPAPARGDRRSGPAATSRR